MNSSSLSACHFEGNGDLYGLGVRTGLYTQWAATLITTVADPHAENVVMVLNMLIQTALLLGLVILSARHEASVLDPVITFWLLFGALSNLTGDGVHILDHPTGSYRLILYAAVAMYYIWFWFTGWMGMLDPDCDPTVFFGNVNIRGRYSIFAQAMSILGLVVCITLAIWRPLRDKVRGLEGRKCQDDRVEEELGGDADDPQDNARQKEDVPVVVPEAIELAGAEDLARERGGENESPTRRPEGGNTTSTAELDEVPVIRGGYSWHVPWIMDSDRMDDLEVMLDRFSWEGKWGNVNPYFLCLSVMNIALSIAAVEYLIKANNIAGANDVDSVGQLIALVSGAFSLIFG
ncbi:hypothetical protein FOXG_16027 [Fusarium oxysporum f. sp. lycopersici 4287]|uniref:Uncharacterized protein n=2 Tax=Fusarium oxysporum TaxID=5507 RepID=A0A0J9W6A8_FUSO4|nr:hypothetical protein FOXG_15568 [Fusarium oxysporum f. sp. lycopersici 4287]XP_018256385.1 uncharacterized protein FOXG_16027 [Fusarium oxysporum f. sp. lycopersici 4287]KAJ9419873.1 hypothetical protein QL093DRAFT_1461982 [Fusarium oxysporum]KNB17826.1 hypothetical protein FOXG_15568 [Fusarium oxysporum f. sp. lycopersici 4287]KNB18340.1 hypothetical protein FOXG_16027 [Fusarium oxysporum f. sp. lycopersici 4287]